METMSDAKRELEELQKELATIDTQLVSVLDARARLARRAGELRRGSPGQPALHDRPVLASVLAKGSGDMPAEDLRSVLRDVYAACLGLEEPATIACLGPEGGPACGAARARFGAAAKLLPTDGVTATLEEVVRKRAELAIVPIETRRDGPVQSTLSALLATELRIVAVVEHTVDLHLATKSGGLEGLQKIYATAADHAHAELFVEQLPGGPTVVDVRSPVLACRHAAEDPTSGALASADVAEGAGLVIARRSIGELGAEAVRYAVVGTRPASRSGDDRTALVFSVHDEPGALLSVLKHFADRSVNVTKIQSRPSDEESWVYLFFVEVSGHATDRALVSALEDVKRQTRFFRVLGSYPAVA
jgi:chorismate mutase/prephenate dehydratase